MLTLEYFNPLTSGEQQVGIVSDEDATEGRWQERRLLTSSERRKQGQREQSHTFWMRRKWNEPFGSAGPTDARVTNRKMKRIILLEFKRTSDASETYYSDVKKTADTSMATHSYSDGPQRPGERSRLGGGTRYFHWSQGRDRSRKRRG